MSYQGRQETAKAVPGPNFKPFCLTLDCMILELQRLNQSGDKNIDFELILLLFLLVLHTWVKVIGV